MGVVNLKNKSISCWRKSSHGIIANAEQIRSAEAEAHLILSDVCICLSMSIHYDMPLHDLFFCLSVNGILRLWYLGNPNTI